jgi:hypothetical protein
MRWHQGKSMKGVNPNHHRPQYKSQARAHGKPQRQRSRTRIVAM